MEQVIEQIAAETGMDELLVGKIVRSQFEYLRHEMAQNELNEVRLTYLGRWKVLYKPETFKNIQKKEEFIAKYGENNNIKRAK